MKIPTWRGVILTLRSKQSVIVAEKGKNLFFLPTILSLFAKKKGKGKGKKKDLQAANPPPNKNHQKRTFCQDIVDRQSRITFFQAHTHTLSLSRARAWTNGFSLRDGGGKVRFVCLMGILDATSKVPQNIRVRKIGWGIGGTRTR